MRLSWTSRALAASLIALVVFCAVIALSNAHLPPRLSTSPAQDAFPKWPLVTGLAKWDAGWYVSIARDGYWYKPGAQSPVAFFPAYPMAIRALTWIGLNPWIAAIFVSALCGPLAIQAFFQWARRFVSDEHAFAAALLLIVYPFSFYLFGVAYSEALFLVLAIPAFLFLERGNLWLATLFGALATTCRPVAPAIVLGLVVRQIELRRSRGEAIRPTDFLPVLSAAGMAAYMAFLWWQFGEPLAFAKVQAAPGWDHPPGWRTWLKVVWFETMFPRVAVDVGFRLALHAALTLGALALVFPMRRRLGWGYALYTAAAVGIPALNMKDFQGMGRYALAGFPCILVLSMLIGERRRLRWAVVGMSSALALFIAGWYGRGGWVA